MKNRERDKVSQSDRSTETGRINRDVSSRQGRENDSSADFGQSIGRSEEFRGETGRNSGADRSSSATGRSGSIGNMGGGGRNGGVVGSEGESSIDRDRDRDRDLERNSEWDRDPSEGRH